MIGPVPFGGDPVRAFDVRRLHCAHYGECVDAAERAGWESFACGGCTRFEAQPLEQEESDRVILCALGEWIRRSAATWIMERSGPRRRPCRRMEVN